MLEVPGFDVSVAASACEIQRWNSGNWEHRKKKEERMDVLEEGETNFAARRGQEAGNA